MSTYSPFIAELTGEAAEDAAQSWGGRLASALVWPFRMLVREARLHRTETALRELDDRTLADIGLHRSQLGSVATYVVDRVGPDPRHVLR